MAFVYGDRVKETSLSVGTGPMVLGGPTTGFVDFVTGIGIGNECFYGIINTIDNTWEMGRGTVGAGTLTRDTVFSSSNSDLIVNFVTGDKLVYTTIPEVFFAGALDSASHALEDHTVGPLNLLDVTTHSAIDHTAAPLSLLTAAAHDVIDHTLAPFNLLDATAHDAIDHTLAPLSLLDEPAHALVDHTLSPFFLLDTTAHAALDHASAVNNNPTQVTAPERTAGTETALRSFSPEDIALMAGFHSGGGGGTPMQVRLDTLTWSAETGPKSTAAYPFTPLYAISVSNFHRDAVTAVSTASFGLITGTGSNARGAAVGGTWGSSDADHVSGSDADAIAMVVGTPDGTGNRGYNTNFSAETNSWELDVTAFAPGGITVAPAGGVGNITGRMFLLVVGS